MQATTTRKKTKKVKTSWSKWLIIASDIVIAAYITLAFASFDKKADSKALCSKVKIEIADNATGGFLDANVIQDRLKKTGHYPIGKKLKDIDTRGIEDMLKRSPFVKTAECYKTEAGNVYISVTQRMPVIRIKADNGDDYYVDDNDCIMPRTNYTSDLIIASGNISRWYATNYISPLGKAIMQNDLWKNLIEQIHITEDHGVELVPRLGEHIVYIGQLPDGKDKQKHEKDITEFISKKMTRLEKFYKYGLSQVGWNRYSYVNIEFDNQIICRKKEIAPPAAVQQPAGQPQDGQQHDTATAEDGPSEGEVEETKPQTDQKKEPPTDSKKTDSKKPNERDADRAKSSRPTGNAHKEKADKKKADKPASTGMANNKKEEKKKKEKVADNSKKTQTTKKTKNNI